MLMVLLTAAVMDTDVNDMAMAIKDMLIRGIVTVTIYVHNTVTYGLLLLFRFRDNSPPGMWLGCG